MSPPRPDRQGSGACPCDEVTEASCPSSGASTVSVNGPVARSAAGRFREGAMRAHLFLRRSRPGSVAAAAIVIAVFAAACSSSKSSTSPSSSTTTRTIPAPVGLSAFYAVPDPLPAGQPGQIVRAERVTVPGVHGTVWRVMYHSRSVRGADIPVTGFIVVPSTPAPKDGYPVISWGHGLTGIADICAPSAHLDNPAALVNFGDTLDVDDMNQMLDRGYLVVRTDYEGLGTPGRYPYLVGDSAARGATDLVRAARNLPQTHASTRNVVIGHSSGGDAPLFAVHIADSWAPELHLLGAVAEAPPSQLENLATALGRNANFEVLSAAAGFNAAYGDQRAPLDAALTARAKRLLADVDRVCTFPQFRDETISIDPALLLKTDPAKIPAWDLLLRQNDAGKFTTPSPEPLLVVHGAKDELVPAISSQLLFDQLCKIHQDLTRWLYPGINHGDILHASLPDTLTWVGHRFANQPTPDHMTPAAEPGIQTQQCPTS
jgi:hypothetical protein